VAECIDALMNNLATQNKDKISSSSTNSLRLKEYTSPWI